MVPDEEVDRRVREVLADHWLGRYSEAVAVVTGAARTYQLFGVWLNAPMYYALEDHKSGEFRHYRRANLEKMAEEIQLTTKALNVASEKFAWAMAWVLLTDMEPFGPTTFVDALNDYIEKKVAAMKAAELASAAAKNLFDTVPKAPELDDREGSTSLTERLTSNRFRNFAWRVARLYPHYGRELYREDGEDLENLLCKLHEALTGRQTYELPKKNKLMAWLRRELSKA